MARQSELKDIFHKPWLSLSWVSEPRQQTQPEFLMLPLSENEGEANISTRPVWGNKLLRERGLQQQQPLNTALVFLLKKIS